MRKWFSEIANRDEAVRVIDVSSTVFIILAIIQLFVGILLFAAHADKISPINDEAAFNLAGTGAIVLVLGIVLTNTRSRIVSLLLLAIAVFVTVSTLATPIGAPKGNLLFAIIAIWAGGRAVLATFRLRGRLAKEGHITERPIGQEKPKPAPAADFVSYPKGGVESTAATAAISQPPKPYDKEKWAALLKYDDDIAIVAARIRPLGERWIDELARAYLALNDKQYLGRIEEKIIADAMAWAARARL